MNPVEKSIASLRFEGALVGLCAAGSMFTGVAVGLAAKLNFINPRLDALFPLFMVFGLIALSDGHLARRIGDVAAKLSAEAATPSPGVSAESLR
jgi:hypothetical protein